MIINYRFTSYDGQIMEGMRTEFDRNYDDEETAIFFVEDEHHSLTDGYFEVNIRKNKDGRLMQEGYVAEYENSDQTEASHLTDLQVTVKEHDFDETLKTANETLQPFGMSIVLEYDGEMYWSVGSQAKGQMTDWYVAADFECEVQSHIHECLAHVLARIKNPELVQSQENSMDAIRKLWEGLTERQQVDLMVEFYYDLMDADKDRFLEETGNS